VIGVSHDHLTQVRVRRTHIGDLSGVVECLALDVPMLAGEHYVRGATAVAIDIHREEPGNSHDNRILGMEQPHNRRDSQPQLRLSPYDN